jgi:chemotaxis protein MotB
MNRLRQRRHLVEHDNVDRWLVSYADYMTLLFALFVVLYAMAMVNEKQFESITKSLGRVFQATETLPKNKGHGDDILPVNSSKTNKNLYGNGILAEAGPELTEGEKQLSNIKDHAVGTNLTSLEQALHTALYDLVESGYAKLEIDGDWLEIELNSGLLFPSGSASPTNSAKAIISAIYDVIGQASNFVRIRGYTDNQPIDTEIFSSNWELSVARATAILKLLEAMNMNPARMAIEGYGEYYPIADNNTAQGRSKNRRVVIAISKYGLKQSDLLTEPKVAVENLKSITDKQPKKLPEQDQANKVKVIRLKNGGLRITTRQENGDDLQNNLPQDNKQNNK